MIATQHLPPSENTVLGRISFIEDNPNFATEKPYMMLLRSNGTFPSTNCTFSSRPPNVPTAIRDRRPSIATLSFQDDGFVILSHPLRFPAAALAMALGKPDPPDHLLAHLQEVTEFIKAHLGADKAICIDWRVSNVATLLRRHVGRRYV